MKKRIFGSAIVGTIAAAALPFITYAQGNPCTPYTLKCLVGKVIDYIQVGIYLIIGLAIITFVWNIYRYFFTEKDKKEAGMYVLYSVIGFFVILSFWGLVAVLSNSLSLPNNQPAWPFNGGASGSNFNSTGGSTNNDTFHSTGASTP